MINLQMLEEKTKGVLVLKWKTLHKCANAPRAQHDGSVKMFLKLSDERSQ